MFEVYKLPPTTISNGKLVVFISSIEKYNNDNNNNNKQNKKTEIIVLHIIMLLDCKI